MHTLLYLFLALLGLGFLVFIHELGHYFMARRVGMRIEAFGIGFGTPIYSWERHGIKWNLGWLPFGGYVRIAGMEKQGKLEPSQIPDGFFGKRPRDRILVAVMGPLVNIVFAFVAFLMIWISGGREKPFADYTHLIGWVDPTSKLYGSGLRPGDEINQVNGRPFGGFKDLLYALALDRTDLKLDGMRVDYETGAKVPYQYTFDSQQDHSIEQAHALIGALAPASHLVYLDTGFIEQAPISSSGILPHDQMIWIDGEEIFSRRQLSYLINEPVALLTVKRGTETFISRIPRLKVADLRLEADSVAELDDWRHAQGLEEKTQQLFFIPYQVTNEAVVVNPLVYINAHSEEETFLPEVRSRSSIALQKGDQILAVDGTKVNSASELFSRLQTRAVQMIVKRGGASDPVLWKSADGLLQKEFLVDHLEPIIRTMGTVDPQFQSGSYVLLNPVVPKPISSLQFNEKRRQLLEQEKKKEQASIAKIKDVVKREEALQHLNENQKLLSLGALLVDESVIYNPTPFTLFNDVFNEISRTMGALFTGYLSPKGMAGPVGIVQVMMSEGWSQGLNNALFWMGLISLNLAMLNLLPLPVLDGGHILFACIEKITGRPLKAKTMEKLVIPFLVLLVGAFIYFTFQDLSRLVQQFF